MTDTPNRPPLWDVMRTAYDAAPPAPMDADNNWTVRRGYAAEIRALRDWLVPEEPLYDGDQRWELERGERQRLRALLTTEADRAERGDE